MNEPYQTKMSVSACDQTCWLVALICIASAIPRGGRAPEVCGDVWSVIPPSLSLQLSPKKTWEGFIGGFFATVLFGLLVSSNHGASFMVPFPS